MSNVQVVHLFVGPRKTGDLRVVADSKELKNVYWGNQTPSSSEMERFKYTAAFDLRKGYFYISVLDKETQKLCTINLPYCAKI